MCILCGNKRAQWWDKSQMDWMSWDRRRVRGFAGGGTCTHPKVHNDHKELKNNDKEIQIKRHQMAAQEHKKSK